MFNQRFRPKFFRASADKSHAQKVLDLYLKHHQDELLGFGYHQFIQAGRGVILLTCGYRDLFFGKGFFPKRQYLNLMTLSAKKISGEQETSCHLANYDPETEMIVYLEVEKSDLYCLSRLSKKGLMLTVLHRQYLNRLLDYVAVRSILPS
jgi:hypothetical protein